MILLAVDIGGTNHSVALVGEDGAVLEKERRPTDRVPVEFGKGIYGEDFSARTYDEMLRQAEAPRALLLSLHRPDLLAGFDRVVGLREGRLGSCHHRRGRVRHRGDHPREGSSLRGFRSRWRTLCPVGRRLHAAPLRSR
jgi:hypothetical protein